MRDRHYAHSTESPKAVCGAFLTVFAAYTTRRDPAAVTCPHCQEWLERRLAKESGHPWHIDRDLRSEHPLKPRPDELDAASAEGGQGRAR